MTDRERRLALDSKAVVAFERRERVDISFCKTPVSLPWLEMAGAGEALACVGAEGAVVA